MKQYLVDSNVFLQFFSRDDPKHSAAAGELFQKEKDGKIKLFCGPPVFFEVVWVLRSFYKLQENVVLDVLESMPAIPNLTVADAGYVGAAIALARNSGCGFADSYIATYAEAGAMGIATFNTKHFKKFQTELLEF